MKITEEELKEFRKRIIDYQTMPIMQIGKINSSQIALDLVNDFIKEMGNKYNFNIQTHGIHTETGEIMTYEKLALEAERIMKNIK